jgi:tyrosine-protein phosphatase SIW14
MRRRLTIMLAIAAIGATTVAVVSRKLGWKRFAEVEAGVLYRSGQLTPAQLRAAAARYNLRTVFSFTFTDDEEEEALCKELGVRRHFHYLAGNGVGPADAYLKFLAVVGDPANHPVLVHCSAGVQRTGGAVAMYRMVQHGWDFDRAWEEAVYFGNDGNEPQRLCMKKLAEQLIEPAALARRTDR